MPEVRISVERRGRLRLSLDIRKRYFAHLAEYLAAPVARHRYVMLSGGVDSFVLLAGVMRAFEARDVTALVTSGMNTRDYRKAVEAAAHFGVHVRDTPIYIKDFIDNAHLSRGTKDKSVFQFMFRVAAHMMLRDLDIKGCAVYQGDGADSLYGNHSPFVYIETNQMAARLGITKDEAREMLRRGHRKKKMGTTASGTARLVGDIIRARGGIAVQPFVSGEFEYVLDVPLREFKMDQKVWVRDGLVMEWGIDRSIVASRERMTMQQGTGLYELLCEEMCATYGTRTAAQALRKIVEGLA